MRISRAQSHAAFTLVEVLIAVTLGLAVLAGVLNSYSLLARNFTRSLGITSANQPSLETQTRNTLATFAQDVSATSAIQGSPSANAVTLTIPTSTSTNTIAYYYNSAATETTTSLAGYSKTVPANTLVRVDGNTGTMQTLQSGILTLSFRYYDMNDNRYTVFSYATTGFSSYLGIKQISLELTCQGGNSANKTLTQVYSASSSRVLMRNKGLLQ